MSDRLAASHSRPAPTRTGRHGGDPQAPLRPAHQVVVQALADGVCPVVWWAAVRRAGAAGAGWRLRAATDGLGTCPATSLQPLPALGWSRAASQAATTPHPTCPPQARKPTRVVDFDDLAGGRAVVARQAKHLGLRAGADGAAEQSGRATQRLLCSQVVVLGLWRGCCMQRASRSTQQQPACSGQSARDKAATSKARGCVGLDVRWQLHRCRGRRDPAAARAESGRCPRRPPARTCAPAPSSLPRRTPFHSCAPSSIGKPGGSRMANTLAASSSSRCWATVLRPAVRAGSPEAGCCRRCC